jgi:hypothetical protein
MRVVQFQTVISFQNEQQSRSFGTSFKFPEGPNSEKSDLLFLNRFVTYLRANILKALSLAHLLKPGN